MMTWAKTRNHTCFLLAINADIWPFFKHSANPHSSIQSCENYFLQIVTSQLSSTLFNSDEFLKMAELLTFDWVSYIAGHPVPLDIEKLGYSIMAHKHQILLPYY